MFVYICKYICTKHCTKHLVERRLWQKEESLEFCFLNLSINTVIFVHLINRTTQSRGAWK